MRLSSSSSSWPTPCHLRLLSFLPFLLPVARAIDFQSVASPNLDLSGLGRVAFTGQFDSISLYEYIGQDEDNLSANGSQSLYGRYPTGQFAQLDSSDAYIQSMCPFVSMRGVMNGIVVGGNFTNIGSQQANAVAMYNPTNGAVTPLPGLTGTVSAVYCDDSSATVYVGGDFMGSNSTNAIAWVNGWTNLPFAGFNGPVSSITKLPNGNIVFGGQFTASGNLTAMQNMPVASPQVINFGSANVTAVGGSLNNTLANPAGIICTTPGKTSLNTDFLLQDHAPGSIIANFGYGFEPSRLRLLNTQTEGWGTKTWRFTALNINGILNFTYHDAQGTLQSCTNECPLAQNSSYQDFYFVNSVGMNSFRLDISDWYGQGGGLGGIELFQNAIFSYAVDNFNSPDCDGISNTNASSTNTGPWTVAPSGDSFSQYLTTTLPNGTGDHTDVSVVFMPNIEQSGTYSINMWTPGCLADNSCSTRGEVNITADFGTPTGSAPTPYSTTLYQTNNLIKYDQIYYGYIEARSDGFRPTITLTPNLNQNGPLTVVAQSLGFNLTMASNTSSTELADSGGSSATINGLFEFNPNQVNYTADSSTSTIDIAGASLDDGAIIMSMTVINGNLYAAGSFSSSSFENIMTVENGSATDLGNGGLNDYVQTVYYDSGTLYAGGNFTNTNDSSTTGLANVASYDIASRKWKALGSGVNGVVYDIIPLSINISSTLEQAIAISGEFNKINAFGDNAAISVSNLALWIPSSNNWLQNLDSQTIALSGRLNAYTSVPGQQPIFSGSIDSQMLSASGVVGLTSSNELAVQQYPINFQASQSATSSFKVKRNAPQGNIDGVVTGLYYNENGLNLTIVGGHFSALASNGSSVSNLAIINGTNSNHVTGLAYNGSSDGSVLALSTQGSTLYVGGSIDNGIMFYDLASAAPSASQPPSLSGADATVYSIALQPSSSNLFVGGSFENAGSLGCPGLCIYDTTLEQWNQPAASLSGRNTINFMQWASSDRLILAGELTVSGAQTKMATYSPKNNLFTAVPGTAGLPGPITAFTAMDSSFTTSFAAGISTANQTAFLSRFDGHSTWTSVSGLGPQSTIQDLQPLSLSSSHASAGLMDSDEVLLVVGLLELAQYGNVSAALFNGTAFTPFILSTMDDGSPGTIYSAFVQNPGNLLSNNNHHLALGFVVLIGLACALGAVFLLVVIGILVERIRRKREGYVPAPTGAVMYEKSGGGRIGNISPDRLFRGVGGSPTDESRL